MLKNQFKKSTITLMLVVLAVILFFVGFLLSCAKSYNITILDAKGKVLSKQKVKHRKDVVFPKENELNIDNGYIFKQWYEEYNDEDSRFDRPFNIKRKMLSDVVFFPKLRTERYEYEVTKDKKVVITKHLLKDDITNIPKIIENKPVEEIAEGVFRGYLGEINMPDTIKVIDKFSFANVKLINKVSKNILKIGDNSFEGSKFSVEKFDFTNVSHLGKNAFKNTKGITTIDLKNQDVIPDGIFSNIKDLRKVENSNIKTIGDEAFSKTSINFNDVVKKITNKIGKNAFYNVLENNQIIQDELLNLEEIGDSAFENTNLEKIKLTNSLKILGNKVFKGAKKLTEIGSLNGVEYIGDEAFLENKINNFNFANVIQVGKKAFSKTNIRNAIFSEKIKKIGESAFESCEFLEEVVFNGITNLSFIGAKSFYACTALKGNITINAKDTIYDIGSLAFGNTKVSEFKINQKVTYMGSRVFDTLLKDKTKVIIKFTDSKEHWNNWSGESEVIWKK